MSTAPNGPFVRWIRPEDAAWLQNPATPGMLTERVCEGFRVAFYCLTPESPPSAWLAGTLQPGGVGFLDPPGAVGEISLEQATALLKFFKDRFAPQSGLIQLMLPSEPGVLEAAATGAGFEFGAKLLLLGRSIAPEEIEPLDPTTHFLPSAEELSEVLQKTYEGTLDCPVLSGKRPIAEVIEGYAATGASGRKYWRTLLYEGAPVGCVLVALHEKLELSELVYMGLLPRARGNGIGGHLLMEAERLTLSAGVARMVIGVDAANRPARAIYEAAGYLPWEEKQVYLSFGEKGAP